MQSATITKIGNSAGVAIPANLRADGCFSVGQRIQISRPRKGTIVLQSYKQDCNDALAQLDATEAKIQARCKHVNKWPKNTTAQDLINTARKDRAHGSISL